MINELVEMFSADTEHVFATMEKILDMFQNGNVSVKLVNRFFRMCHSFKSEAHYLQYQELAEKAHQLEGILAEIRKNLVAENRGSDAESVEDGILVLQELFKELKRLFYASVTGVTTAERAGAFNEIKGQDNNKIPVFNTLEVSLLREAMMRQERFFAVNCFLAEDVPMPVARLYLVLNNLEREANVVTTIPSLEEHQSEDLREFTAYITSSKDENSLLKTIDVDQIEEVVINAFDWKSILLNEELDGTKEQTGNEVGNGTISSATDIILVDRRNFQNFVRSIDSIAMELKNNREISSEIIEDIQTYANSLATVKVKDIFKKIEYAAYTLAQEEQKKIEVVTNIDVQEIPFFTRQAVEKSLLHLIRNSLRHGIEASQIRIASGKDETGQLYLSARKTESGIDIIVEDDGAGFESDRSNTIIGGNTSMEDADMLSGRGEGLNAVKELMEEIDGSFRIDDSISNGARIVLSLSLE